MKKNIRTGLIGLITTAALSLGGCAIGVKYSHTAEAPQGNYVSRENFLPYYQQIANSPLNEREKEKAYEQLMGDFRNSTREENFNPIERQWASNPLNREMFAKDFLRKIGPDGSEWFYGLGVDFVNPSREDAVFMLRYNDAAKVRRY